MRYISSHTVVTIVCSLSPEEFWEWETQPRWGNVYPFRVERIHITVYNGESLFGSTANISGPLIKKDGQTGLVRKYGEITVGELPEPIRDRIVGEFEQKRRLWRRPERQS
jgi:hypothetical protein